MTYENFIVPNIYWEYVLRQHIISFINEYYKKHKNYPSDEILQEVVLTDEEKEKYKRIFYAQYKATGIVPNEPNIPQEPPISTNTQVNVNFKLKFNNEVKCIGEHQTNLISIIIEGIENLDLIDNNNINITLRNTLNNELIKICDLKTSYLINTGVYEIYGNIGTLRETDYCYPILNISNKIIKIEEDGDIYLDCTNNEVWLISDDAFKFRLSYNLPNDADFVYESYLYKDTYIAFEVSAPYNYYIKQNNKNVVYFKGEDFSPFDVGSKYYYIPSLLY